VQLSKADDGGENEFSKGCLEDAHSFIDLELHCIGWDVGVVARMDGQLECNAGCHHVFGNGHDKTEMAMTPTAMGQRYGAGISLLSRVSRKSW